MERFRLIGLALPALLLISASARGQHPIVYEVMGKESFDHFGESLALLNDIDGDAVRDFIAGNERRLGYIRLISGKTGTILRTWRGTVSGEELGFCLTAMGDLDGDGNTDFAAAAWPADIAFFSPVKEGHLARFSHNLPPDRFAGPTQLTSADLDGDRISDIVLGDPGHVLRPEGQRWINTGRASAYSGKDQRLLWHVFGSKEDNRLGASVVAIGDVDGDGFPDVAIGEPMGFNGLDDGRNFPGRVHIVRGKDGQDIRILDTELGYFGQELCNVGDLDGDGFVELAIAATGYRKDRGDQQGWVGIHSTRTFEVLFSFTGLEGILNEGFHGDGLGYRLGSAGDVDLDGIPDFLIAAYRVGPGIGPDYGRLDLRSGKTGDLLASYQETQFIQSWLGALSPLDDVDGDGRPEFIIGSPNIPIDSLHGKVQVIRFESDEPRFVRGDANGDGMLDISDVIAILGVVYFHDEPGPCLEAMDAGGDGVITWFDAGRVLTYLFLGAYAPSPPFPECGRFGGLRTKDLGCRSSPCMTDR